MLFYTDASDALIRDDIWCVEQLPAISEHLYSNDRHYNDRQ